jgi:hypothetical protein
MGPAFFSPIADAGVSLGNYAQEPGYSPGSSGAGDPGDYALVRSAVNTTGSGSILVIFDPGDAADGRAISASATSGLPGWGLSSVAYAKPMGEQGVSSSVAMAPSPLIIVGTSPPTSSAMVSHTNSSGLSVEHLELPGILDANHPSMDYEIPYDGTSSLVGLTVRGSGAGGEAPSLGPIVLYSPMGVALEQFNTGNGPGQMPPQSMAAILKDVPLGGHLDVQVTATSSSASPTTTDSATQTAAGTTSGWNMSFMLDVQKQGLNNSTEETTSPIQGRLAIGTLVVAAQPQSNALFSASNDTVLTDPNELSVAQSSTVTTTPVSTDIPPTDEATAEPFDGFDVRVSTGPLASRSASPLGPTLASIDADATQPVDRHERALSQEIAGLSAGESEVSAAWRARSGDSTRSGFGVTIASTAEALGRSQPVVAIAGHGGLPIKVTSAGHGSSDRLTDLWATLPSDQDFAKVENTPAKGVAGPIELSSLTDEADLVDADLRPDYARAAFGLAIGVGLAAGPILPELMAADTRRLSRVIAGLQTRLRRGIGSPSGSNPSQAKRSWAARRFSPPGR